MTAFVPDIARVTSDRHDMFPRGVPVVAMVSGGGDSVALLHLLASGVLGEGLGLSALHVNHLLRGENSEGDEAFVRELCDRLGVPCRVARYDVGAWAQAEGLNLEDAGRRVRYRFAAEELDARCDAAGIRRDLGRIAVAHTLDDRVETFLMRLVAGAGAGGLASIAPVRGRIARPLLDCERADVRAWLAETGLDWREDATNDDTTRTRARIRAELLPALESFNPRVRDALARTTDVLAEEDALLGEMAARFGHDFAEMRPGESVRFERAAMLSLSLPMRRRVVRDALTDAFPAASRLEAEHVDALVAAMGESTFARDLSFGLRAWGEYGTLVVSRQSETAPPVAPALLELPGIADLGPSGSIVAEESGDGDTFGTADSVVISADVTAGPLAVDGVRPGDRMRPLGMKGSRKLSDLLVDAKVPRRQRPAVPVVRDGERIVWLAGVRMSDEYRVLESTRRAVRLTWRRPQEEVPPQ